MNATLTREFLDTCHAAKRIIKYLPPLPDWMTPRQVFILDAIHQVQDIQPTVRTSDIAKRLDNTMPSITRMVSELEAHGALTKVPDAHDKRSSSLCLTDYGEALYKRHVAGFHKELSALLSGITEEEMRTAIDVFTRAEALLKNHTFLTNEEV
ncbi:MAG: MarR family transcriptional regulator [Peptococcaceae bacterium]|nr:MarR family transcriptional regulator [Peptococcaceae bacterium]